MDIGGWLRSLGLGQYEPVFRDNGIEADVLHDLTDQDLEKLGVLLGHRRRLLRAIGELDGVSTATISASLRLWASHRRRDRRPRRRRFPPQSKLRESVGTLR
jgi:hypothetical protein